MGWVLEWRARVGGRGGTGVVGDRLCATGVPRAARAGAALPRPARDRAGPGPAWAADNECGLQARGRHRRPDRDAGLAATAQRRLARPGGRRSLDSLRRKQENAGAVVRLTWSLSVPGVPSIQWRLARSGMTL